MITNRLMRAISFATVKHDGQKRKVDKEPFIAHPYRVAMLLKDHNCDNDLVIAGLLHDVVEDTEGTLKEIEALFGEKVSDLVKAVTEKDKKLNWETRKERSIATIKNAPSNVKLIACADKIDNLHSILDNQMVYGDSMWHEFERGKTDQQWYYKKMYESITYGIDQIKRHSLIVLYKTLLDDFLEQ